MRSLNRSKNEPRRSRSSRPRTGFAAIVRHAPRVRRRRAPPRRCSLRQRPDRRQVLPVDEVVQDERRSGTPSPATNVPGATKPAMPMLRAVRADRRPRPAAAPARRRPSPARARSPGVSIFLPRNTLPTVISRYIAPPTIAARPQMPIRPSSARPCPGTRSRSALPAKLMSQCRRGTPSVPAPIMNSEKPHMPRPNRYGCHLAMPGNISSRRNSVGIRK